MEDEAEMATFDQAEETLFDQEEEATFDREVETLMEEEAFLVSTNQMSMISRLVRLLRLTPTSNFPLPK